MNPKRPGGVGEMTEIERDQPICCTFDRRLRIDTVTKVSSTSFTFRAARHWPSDAPAASGRLVLNDLAHLVRWIL